MFVATLSPRSWSHGGRLAEWRAQARVVDVIVRSGGFSSDEA